MFDDALYRTCQCSMEVDDFIMLFTDGLFEVEAPDQKMYSRELLMVALRERVSLPSANLSCSLNSLARFDSSPSARTFPMTYASWAWMLRGSPLHLPNRQLDLVGHRYFRLEHVG